MEVAGVQVVESERIATEVVADIDPIEGQLARAAKALERGSRRTPPRRWRWPWSGASISGSARRTRIWLSARDEIWLARRSLEENNPTQALTNLAAARQRLRVYREILPQDQRQEVDQMLQEIDQLEAQLRQEGAGTATRDDRARQGRQSRIGGTGSTVGSSDDIPVMPVPMRRDRGGERGRRPTREHGGPGTSDDDRRFPGHARRWLMVMILVRNWWALVLRGVLDVLFGIAAFAWPEITFAVLAILFGAFALVDGCFAIAAAVVGSTAGNALVGPAGGGCSASPSGRSLFLPGITDWPCC